MAGQASILGHYVPADGASSFRHLAREPKVMGFHRIYPYTAIGADRGSQADWLAGLAGLAGERTLGGTWRIFAAEELLERDDAGGLAALAAIAQDTSASRWTRVRAGIRVAVYPRLRPAEPGIVGFDGGDSSSLAVRTLLSRLRELALLAVRGA